MQAHRVVSEVLLRVGVDVHGAVAVAVPLLLRQVRVAGLHRLQQLGLVNEGDEHHGLPVLVR